MTQSAVHGSSSEGSIDWRWQDRGHYACIRTTRTFVRQTPVCEYTPAQKEVTPSMSLVSYAKSLERICFGGRSLRLCQKVGVIPITLC